MKRPAAILRTYTPIMGRMRGFTLLELMVVIVMIGVLVALGIPSISAQMRDRRTNQAAHEIALLYRQARAIAMGRGAAVLIQFNTATRGAVVVKVARNPGDTKNCMGVPATSCNATNWDSANSETVGSFDPASSSLYDNVALAFKNSVPNSEGDMCFSPLGRPYWRPTHAGTQNFQPLTEVPSIEVSPVDTIGLTRTVLILPTGVSRLAL